MIYFEAPLLIKSRQGAIGRGRGWVRKTIGAEKDRNLKLIRCNLFGNLFSHSLSKGGICKRVQRLHRGDVK